MSALARGDGRRSPGPHGVGVVGVGYWGPNVVRVFASLSNCTLVRACDSRPGRLEYVRQQVPQVEICHDYRDLLDDPRLDAICIVTPMETHYDLALQALSAGRHVLVEKPLATSVAQARRLVDEAERRGLVLAAGHLFVYHPAIERLHAELEAGTFGRLCTMQSERINLGPPGAVHDVVWDLAVHDIAIALYLADEPPLEVVAYAGCYVHPTLHDAALVVVRYGGAPGQTLFSQHHVSWLSPHRVRRFFAVGTSGAGLFDGTREPRALTLFGRGYDTRLHAPANGAIELKYGGGEGQTPELPAVEPLRAECAHFLECVETGRPPRADGRAGLRVVQVLEAAHRSLASGSSPVALEPLF